MPSGTKDSVSIDRLKPAYLELPNVNPNSALPKLPPLRPPIMYTHPILVLSPPLKIPYNLPLPQSSPHSKTLLNLPPHLLASLDPNSLALIEVEELTSLPDWPIMYNN
ncbi:unnamed protein product [Hymenolepis diminuta]|uniref:Ovule protein n=1 Tax=Hymenolepis diminuta TaxID=6216 RepID=A0A0R3STN8_HYMDI|nr:unnamed protein product [Hymenolepis diminuta]